MQSVHACAVQTHFSVFVFFLKKGSFGLPFWSILEALGALLAPRGCPGVVLEGSEKEVEKRGPPISYESNGKGGGPYRDSSWDSSWESSRERSRDRARDRLEPRTSRL